MGAEAKSRASVTGREQAASEFIDAQVAFSAPRRLMAELRDVMGREGPAAAKMDSVVSLVARELRADACACFILRAGEVLELFSAQGMLPGAKARVGDGPVGDVAANAAPIIVSDLREARDETGGGAFRAFCGVPVLRGGRVRGVLAVQNRLPRAYGEEAVDILQTVAMVLAELIVSGGIVSRLEINSGFAAGGKPTRVGGQSMGRGVAVGTAVLYEPGLALRDIIAGDTKAEKARLSAAVSSMHGAIDRMLDRNAALQGTESRDILEAYQMFAKDRGWLARIEAAIDKGLTAEAAVQRVQNETRARMMQVNDAYIRERLHDLEDLSSRLQSHLVRQQKPDAARLPESIVLVARALGPAALLDYDHARLKAVVLEKGGHSSHVAIVARSLGIPVVGQCGDIYNFVGDGDQVVVDGDQGVVHVNPPEYVLEDYTRNMEARARRGTRRRQAQKPCATRDGVKVSVQVNAGLLSEAQAARAAGAEGIGLFRTELSFMGWQKYPLVAVQAELYGKVMDEMEGRPVVFRMLDIGGDKPLPYFTPPGGAEENPALGWRGAVRIGMDRPAVLRTQFRALMRGARGRDLKIMLPFLTEVAEFDRARELLEMEKVRARQQGAPVPEKIELGAMIEVPALLWQMDALLKTADFVSVGTNDLMQYLYAADRGNHAMRTRYDILSPAMLRVLKNIAGQCRAAGRPVSVCGEMAGNPLEAMVLIALGYDTLSVPAQGAEAVRAMAATVDTTVLAPWLGRLMETREHSLRERILSFARDHSISV